jgi:AraC-like DNA-binding protein
VSAIRVGGADEWEDFVSHSFYALGVDRVAEGFRASAKVADIGRGISVTDLTSGESALVRTRRLAVAAPSDDLLLLMQLSGTARIEQSGRQLELRPGHATFCDPSVPYTIISGEGQQIVTMVPRREVLPPRMSAADLRLRDFDASSTPLRVYRLLAEEMASDAGSARDGERDGVAAAAGELLRGAAVLTSAAGLQLRTMSNDVLLRTVKDFVLDRLTDPDLTLGDIAAAHGMSPRRLSSLFAPDDSPAAFIRRERLRRVREELLDPRFTAVAVSAVGLRWGYPDPSTLGRAYRRAFGETPVETRRRSSI